MPQRTRAWSCLVKFSSQVDDSVDRLSSVGRDLFCDSKAQPVNVRLNLKRTKPLIVPTRRSARLNTAVN